MLIIEKKYYSLFCSPCEFPKRGRVGNKSRQLARRLKAEGYEVASYTGYTFELLLCGTPEQKQLLQSIDVLIDGPFIREEKSLELSFRGSRNQRILNVPQSLAQGKAVWETSLRWNGAY